MKKLVSAMMILFCLFTFAGCKKDGSNNISEKTRLLTERTWKQVKHENRDNSSDPWVDNTPIYNTCDLDNVISFNMAGNFQETEGATKCIPADPDIVINGTWSFQNNETIVRVSFSLGTADLVIDVLDANTFRYTVTEPGTGHQSRITLEH